MAVVVDQAKLVLNTFAAIFQNNLISKDLVTWKKHDSEMNDRNGLTVVEQVTPRYVVTSTIDGVQDLTTGVQDSVYGSEQYRLNRTFGASMGWGDWNKVRDINSARENEALKAAALALATQIDAYILGYAALASNNYTGDPLLPISDFDDVANGFTRLKEEGVEDPNLRGVLPYGDKQALASTIIYGGYGGQSTLAAPGPVGNASMEGTGFYREGFTGKIADTPVLFTQQLPTFTTGTRTNGAINGAAQNVDYASVAISPAPGQYLTQNIAIDGLGANATIKDGEVFTIDGVFAYDNRLGAPIPRLQQFRVIGDQVASAGGAIAAMRIFPALVVPGTGNIGAGAVNRANATVSAAPADNAVVTWKHGPSVSTKPRFLMNKDAVIINTADLPVPDTGKASRVSLTKLPLSVRMWKDSVFATGEHRVRFDVALSANVVDRRRLVRIGG